MAQKRSSFVFLNLAQFFTVINDNIYKLLLIFQLIDIQGIANDNTILALAGAIFVLPFLLFAATAGTLADRFSKQKVIIYIRMIEIPVVTLGILAFYFKNGYLGYAVLFLMSSLSAFFSPAKYGIIPELVKREEISRYNGILTATVYLGIILGTFFASFLAEISGKNYFHSSFFCLIIAALGALSSLGIKKTVPQASNKKISLRFLSDIIKTLNRAKKIRYLMPVMLFGAYFLFIGAYIQLNIIPFSMQSLNLRDIEGGYLFLITAVGIGIGSFLAGKASGKDVELGIVPLASLALCCILLSLYFFSTQIYVVVGLLILLGIFGGFFIVPLDAFIQAASPDEDRGQNVASANFLSFLGVIFASGFIYLFGTVFDLSAAMGFFYAGWLTLALAILLLYLFGDQLLRLLLSKLILRKVKVTGKKQATFHHPSIIVGLRKSWVDTFIVMSILPRLTRYIIPIGGRFKKSRSLIYKRLKIIPIEEALYFTKAFEVVQNEMSLNHSICLLIPIEMLDSLVEKLKTLPFPIVPISITRNGHIEVHFMHS